MELIRKSDALHAVLHNQGDAAVAAVQEIKPVFTFTDGLQEARKVKMPEIKTMTLEEWKENNKPINPHCGARMDGKDGERDGRTD
jgi:hypothetical protein